MKITSNKFFVLLGILIANIAIVAIIGARILNGTKSFIIGGDAFDQSYMWLSKIFEAASTNQIVLWDFTTSSGVSFIGEQQTAPLYPLALLFGKLGLGIMPYAYDQFLLIHFAIASIGVSILLRRLGTPLIAAIGGAVIFAFTGSFADRINGQPNLFCSLAYIPYMALGLLLIVAEGQKAMRVLGFAIGAVAVALSILAGHLYAIAIGMVCAVCLTTFAGATSHCIPLNFFRSVVWGGLLVFGGALLALPQILATTEYLHLSYKWNSFGPTVYPHLVAPQEYENFSLKFSDLISIFGKSVSMKDGGTLFFTFTGLASVCLLPFTLRFQNKNQTYASYGALLIVILTLIFAFGVIYPKLPLLNQVRSPTRWLFGTGFALSLLAALSISGLMRFVRDHLKFKAKILAQAPLIIFFVLVSVESYKFFGKNLEHPQWSENPATSSIKSPVVAALYNEMGKYQPIYRYYGPKDIIQANLGNSYFSLATEGHRATRTIAYHDYFDFDPLGDHLRNLGVKWLVSKELLKEDNENLKKIWSDGKYIIYQRDDVLPLIWTVDTEMNKSGVPIKSVDWDINKVTFNLKQPMSGRLVFGQTYFPGFIAYADHVSYVVEKYESMMSIFVLNPATTITFEYRPHWFWWSSLIAAVGWVSIFIAFLWVIWVYRPSIKNESVATHLSSL